MSWLAERYCIKIDFAVDATGRYRNRNDALLLLIATVRLAGTERLGLRYDDDTVWLRVQ